MTSKIVTSLGPVSSPVSSGRISSASHRSPGLPLAYRQLVLSRAPVAYWRLKEASGASAVDESGHGYTGIISGGVTFHQASALAADAADYAMQFNGSDGQVRIPYNAQHNPALWSIGAWIRPRAVPGGNVSAWDNRLTNAGPTASGFSLIVASNQQFAASICTANLNSFASNSSTPFVVGNWYYLVATYDGTQARLYTNGALSAGPVTCGYTPNPSADAFIATNFATGHLFADVDEVDLENYVLGDLNIARAWYASRGATLGLSAATQASIAGISTGVQGQ